MKKALKKRQEKRNPHTGKMRRSTQKIHQMTPLTLRREKKK